MIIRPITLLPIEEAAEDILKSIYFYRSHNIERSKEQIADLIADYSDNNDRTIDISTIVWARLRAEQKP